MARGKEQYYGQADASQERQASAERFLESARRVIEGFRGKTERSPKKTENPRLSADVKKVINVNPTVGEFIQEVRKAHNNKLPPKYIPPAKETKETLEARLEVLKTVSPEVRIIVEKAGIKDERGAKLALKLLELDENASREKLSDQIRKQAEELWRHQVGSGFRTESSKDARNLLWELEKNIDGGFSTLSDQDRAVLRSDLGLLIRTSKFPSDIEVPELEGEFGETLKESVDAINSHYDDFEVSDTAFDGSDITKDIVIQSGKADEFNIENVDRDMEELDEVWEEYEQQYKAKHNGNIPPENERQAFNRVYRQLEERYLLLKREEQEARDKVSTDLDRPNQFNLTEKEAREFLKNPIAFLEKKLVRMENSISAGGFDDPIIKGEYERYQLALNYLLYEGFDGQFLESALNNAQTPEAANQILELMNNLSETKRNLTEQKRIFLREMSARFTGIRILPTLSNAGSFTDQNYLQTIKGLSDNFFVEYPSAGGGIVEEANDILAGKAVELLRDKHGKKQRLTHDVIDEAVKATKAEMLDEEKNPEYKEQYIEYLKGTMYQTETNGTDNASTTLGNPEDPENMEDIITFEEYIGAVVNRANIHKHVWLEWEELEARGMAPLEEVLLGPDTGRFVIPRSKLQALKRRRRFDYEQWGSKEGKDALLVAHNRETALFYADHYAHDVDHEAEHMAHHFVEKLRKETDEKKKRGMVEYLFFWNPDTHADKHNEEDWTHLVEQIEKGKLRKEIFQECRVQIGIDIADTHGLQGYSFRESSWRSGDVVEKHLRGIFKSGFNDERTVDTLMKSYLTGSRLTRSSKDYANKKLHHSHGAEEKFHQSLVDVARFRAHNLAEIMLEMEDETFLHWFEHAGLGHDANKTLADMGFIVAKANRSLTRDFINQTDKNAALQYTPIDFSRDLSGWTQPQKDVFSKILNQMGLRGDNQVIDMAGKFKKLHEFIISKDALHRFSNVRYERLLAYSGPRWSDDEPLTLMQHPDRIKFIKDKGNVVSLGFKMSGGGKRESAGPFKRFIMENAQLEEKSMYYPKLLNASEQDLVKMLAEIHNAVSGVHGAEEAAITQEEEQYTWEKMRQLYPGKLAISYNATPYRKYSGNQKADICYPEEAHHLQEKLFEVTANSNEKISALMHTKERNLRISTWNDLLGGEDGIVAKLFEARFGKREAKKRYHQFIHLLNDRYPNKILVDKIAKIGLYALLITALFLFYKAADSASDEIKGSGNVGHAPRGGGHH